MGAFDKPVSSWILDPTHALAPRSANGLIFGFLDGSATSVRDDKSGVVMADTGTVTPSPAWVDSGFPGGSGKALSLINAYGSTGVNRYEKLGYQTGIPAYGTLAAIVKITATTVDGPRVFGMGYSGGMVLEPCYASYGRLFVLNNGVAHVDTGLTTPLNAWLAVGACWKAGSYIDAFVRDYTNGTTVSARIAQGNPSSSDGSIQLGSQETTNGTKGTNGLFMGGFLDYAEWTIADFTLWAAAPWSMYKSPARPMDLRKRWFRGLRRGSR